MNILRHIQFSNTGPVCQGCAYFQNDPAHIEAVYPGLTALSSGFASVRDQDGFCQYHQLYLSAKDNCPKFEKQPSN
jgi:hypothetical protein